MGTDNLYYEKRKGRLARKSRKVKEYKNSILIVCEGEQTEPNYFKSFRISNIQVKTIGTGKNTNSLVIDAINKWKVFAEEQQYFERLWCVFDRDDFPQENYNQAFETIDIEAKILNRKYKRRVGRELKIAIAHSNQAFELWYLLHYNYIDSACNRSEYKRMLSDRMGKTYEKNDLKMYQTLQELSQTTNGRQGQLFAINNAKKLRDRSLSDSTYRDNPSTSVDILVEELNKYLKK